MILRIAMIAVFQRQPPSPVRFFPTRYFTGTMLKHATRHRLANWAGALGCRTDLQQFLSYTAHHGRETRLRRTDCCLGRTAPTAGGRPRRASAQGAGWE